MNALRMRSLRVATGVVLVVLAACAPTKPTIRSDTDKATNFAAFRTFGFAPALGTDRAGYSTLVTDHFKQATRHEMESRGYTYSETQPDLLLNFNVNVRQQTEVRSSPSAAVGVGYYGYRGGMYGTWPMYSQDVDTIHYKVGTANIDVVDASRKQLVWEGVAEGELSDKVMKDPGTAIANVVAEMFKQFPGRAAG